MYKHKLLRVLKNEYNLTYLNVDKDYLLFNEGDICNNIYFIIKGSVAISTLTLNDKEYTFNMLSNDDIFGDSLCFSSNNKYLGDGITTSKSEIIVVSKEVFLNMLKEDLFLNNYLEYCANRNLNIRKEIKLLSQQSIRDKILFYLQSEVKIIKSNVIEIKSKEHLAKLLNIQRPSLSRELINLKKEGLIDYDKYSITLIKTSS